MSEYSSYYEYLRHPKFLAIKAEAQRRAGGSCEVCHKQQDLEPHHIRYPAWGTFDTPENIVMICRKCHCIVHGKDK